MHSSFKVLAAAAISVLSVSAHAEQFVLNFAGAGFSNSSPIPAPTDPAIGSITFSEAYFGAPVIDSVDAIDLQIAGHQYSLSEVGFNVFNIPGQVLAYTFGGLINGVSGGSSGTDDFVLAISGPASDPFKYGLFSYTSSTSSTSDSDWRVGNGGPGTLNYSFTPVIAVPEPETYSLMSIGIISIGAYKIVWKRRKERA